MVSSRSTCLSLSLALVVTGFATLGLGAAGCNPRADYALVGSAEVPSAYGDVKVEEVDDDQLLVTLVIDHLAPPQKLGAELSAYALWFESVGRPPELKAILDYDAEAHVARGMATTALKSFVLRVTAEESLAPESPSDYVITTQSIDEGKD